MARRTISVFDGEPVGESFAVPGIRVAPVDQMPDLVNQNVVEVEVLDGRLGPVEFRALASSHPLPAEHARLDELLRTWRPDVLFDQSLLDRVQINRDTPLHPVTGETAPAAGQRTELNDFQSLNQLPGQIEQSFTNFRFGDRVDPSLAGGLNDVSHITARFGWLVPDIVRDPRMEGL